MNVPALLSTICLRVVGQRNNGRFLRSSSNPDQTLLSFLIGSCGAVLVVFVLSEASPAVSVPGSAVSVPGSLLLGVYGVCERAGVMC